MPKNSPAKARALRISLGSHAQDALAAQRNRLALIAVGICGMWFLASFFLGQPGNQRFSPGPVSRAHASLNCESCHSSSAPLRDDTFLSFFKKSHSDSTELWHRKSDTMCQACHPVAGNTLANESSATRATFDQMIPVSPHSPHQVIATVESCASCHAEHRGVDVLPSKVADSSCVDCHRNLTDFRIGTGDDIAPTVSRFASSHHPEFRSLEQDPGTIKFDHVLHMTAGLVKPGENPELIKTWEDYPARTGFMSEYADASGKVLLDCHFCHLPTNEVTAKKEIPSKSKSTADFAGRFMSLPSYEQQCGVCHSNDIQPRSNSKFVSSLKIEHGATPEKLADDLKVFFSLLATPDELVEKPPVVVVPKDRLPIRLWDGDIPSPKFADDFRDFLAHASSSLNTTCMHCHLSADFGENTALPEVRYMATGAEPNEFRGMTKLNWLEHGQFDHSAHRDVNCRECHTLTHGKTPLAGLGKIAEDKPMIAGLAKCLECHQSGTVAAPKRAGPSNCISCHKYHGGGN